MAVLLGIVLGLSTLLFVGPVFFYLIKSGLEHSVKAGISAALGVITGDAIYAGLLYQGFLPLLQAPENQNWMAIVGGVLLLVLGFVYLVTDGKRDYLKTSSLATSWYYFFGNGFILNFFNPFVIAVWIGFFGIIQTKTTSNTEVSIALYSILVVIFTTDCLKVFFSSKLKRFFTPVRFKRMRQILGVLMILFSFRLLFSVVS